MVEKKMKKIEKGEKKFIQIEKRVEKMEKSWKVEKFAKVVWEL